MIQQLLSEKKDSPQRIDLKSAEQALRALTPLIDQVIEAKSFHDLAKCLLRVIGESIDFDFSAFYFFNPDGDKLELALAQGLTEEERLVLEETAMDRVPGEVIRTRQCFVSGNERIQGTSLARMEIVRSRLYCPLVYHGKGIGVIGLASLQENHFHPEQVQFLQFAASFAAVTYEKIVIQGRMQTAAERLDLARDAIHFGVWDWNYKKNHLVWDDYMYRLFEVAPQDFAAVYQAFEAALHPDDRNRLGEELRDCFAARQPQFASEFRIVTGKGEVKIIGARARCIYDGNGDIDRLVGANWDMTGLRNTEAKLILASKMSSLGELAAGVSHEINNPLVVISGYSNAMRDQIRAGKANLSEIEERLGKISASSERIARIVKGLRHYSSSGPSEGVKKYSINEIVKRTLELAAPRLKVQDIEVRRDLTSEPDSVLCNEQEISQVFLNLFNNAVDAVANLPERWLEVSTKVDAGKIRILVTDSGHGIPEKIRSKVFQPFFTTKPVGQGTGLGLSISYGLIHNNRGTLEVDITCPNTRFVVTLPLLDALESFGDLKGRVGENQISAGPSNRNQ